MVGIVLVTGVVLGAAAVTLRTSGGASSTASAAPAKGTPTPAQSTSFVGRMRSRYRHSVARIDTPTASGTAMVIGGGYLVTTARAVDPYRTVSVTFGANSTSKGVPVVGVDLLGDVAVLGPLKAAQPARSSTDGERVNDGGRGTDQTPIRFGRGPKPKPGDRMTFVGYPNVNGGPVTEVQRSALGDLGPKAPWDVDQADTKVDIQETTAGSLVVDGSGHPAGMVTSDRAGDTTRFLLGRDLAKRIKRIRTGHGSESKPNPAGRGKYEFAVETSGPQDYQAYFLTGSEVKKPYGITVGGTDPMVMATEAGGVAFRATKSAVGQGPGPGIWALAAEVADPETPTDRWSFATGRIDSIIVVGSSAPGPAIVRFRSRRALLPVRVDLRERPVAVGQTVSGRSATPTGCGPSPST